MLMTVPPSLSSLSFSSLSFSLSSLSSLSLSFLSSLSLSSFFSSFFSSFSLSSLFFSSLSSLSLSFLSSLSLSSFFSSFFSSFSLSSLFYSSLSPFFSSLPFSTTRLCFSRESCPLSARRCGHFSWASTSLTPPGDRGSEYNRGGMKNTGLSTANGTQKATEDSLVPRRSKIGGLGARIYSPPYVGHIQE